MTEKLEIPELKHLQPQQYQAWLKRANDPEWDEDDSPRSRPEKATAAMALELRDAFERISRLERENEELRAKVARLYRPIDDAEWEQFHGYEFGFKVLHRREANALIRARLAAAQEAKQKGGA